MLVVVGLEAQVLVALAVVVDAFDVVGVRADGNGR